MNSICFLYVLSPEEFTSEGIEITISFDEEDFLPRNVLNKVVELYGIPVRQKSMDLIFTITKGEDN